MSEIKSNRRWLRPRFGLRTMFVVITVFAGLCAWHGHRLRVLNAERERLRGIWLVGDELHGHQIDYLEKQDLGMPSDGIGQIDFHLNSPTWRPDGDILKISRGI